MSLEEKALSARLLSPQSVKIIYEWKAKFPSQKIELLVARKAITELCESHERLRTELEGAMQIMKELETEALRQLRETKDCTA